MKQFKILWLLLFVLVCSETVSAELVTVELLAKR